MQRMVRNIKKELTRGFSIIEGLAVGATIAVLATLSLSVGWKMYARAERPQDYEVRWRPSLEQYERASELDLPPPTEYSNMSESERLRIMRQKWESRRKRRLQNP